MMHELSKWILRVMIVLGAIGFGTLYVMRNGWVIAEMPPVFDGGPALPAPASDPAPLPAAGSGQAFAPCQPIGRTARGELVYSMDCQRFPALAPGKAASAAASSNPAPAEATAPETADGDKK